MTNIKTGGNLNILLMDDGRPDAASLINELRNEGILHTFKRTETKDSFIGALTDFKPNLIIADYQLPYFDGKNFLEIARTSNPDMMVILVNRKLGEEVIIELLRDGRNELKLIDKPANFIPAIKSAIKRASEKISSDNNEDDFQDLIGKLDCLFEGILKIGEKGTIVKCNGSFLELSGYEKGLVTGKRFESFVDACDLKIWSEALETMMTRGKAKAEIRVVRNDGSVFVGGILLMKNSGYDGKFPGYYCFVEDKSMIKQAEQSIWEAQKTTAASLNSLNERIAILDHDGNIQAVNRAWTAFALHNGDDPKDTSVGTNYLHECENTKGKNIRESREFAEGIKKVLNGEISEFSVRYPHNTPLEKRWYLAKVSKFFGENSRKAVILHEDITGAMQAQIELAKSEEKFRNLVKHSTDIISVMDRDGKLRYISPTAARIFGSETNYREGRNVFEFIHPEDAEIVKAAFEKGLKSPNEPVMVEFRYRKPDGKYIYLESIANNLLLDPSVEGIVVNSREITERKIAEESSKAALKEKDVLLKEVHHRVKNNLQIVSSLLKLQEDHITDDSFKKIFRESINRIKAMSLIHQRLYQEHRLSKINFGSYLSSIVEFLKETYDANQRNIKCSIITENLDLNLETAIPCGLIVNELVSNSLRHAFEGRNSGELVIKLESNGINSITISDNGIGLPENFKLQECKTLGMQMVSNLASQLSADVKICTSGGTKFWITFDNQEYSQRVKEENI